MIEVRETWVEEERSPLKDTLRYCRTEKSRRGRMWALLYPDKITYKRIVGVLASGVQLVGTSYHTLKGHRFDSWPGHM